MRPAICPICHVEYLQRWDRDGSPLGTPARDMAEHIRWCRCWHCERFGDPGTERRGTCRGGIEHCPNHVPDRTQLLLTADREAEHNRANRRAS